MSWLTDLLEQHPEIALDDADDRARLADLVEDAFPRAELVDALRCSALAVLNVRQLRNEIAPGVDIKSFANELARNCAAGAQGVLYKESDEIAHDQLAVGEVTA